MALDKETASIERALCEVEKISSLDTARMTIRWALEKLRALESDALLARAKSEADRKEAANAERERDAAREETRRFNAENSRLNTLTRSLESRFVLLLADGKAGVALAHYEAELLRREDELHALREKISLEAAEEKAVLTEESRLIQQRLDRGTRLEAAKAQEQVEAQTATVRDDLSSRFVELHEGLARLHARERAHEQAQRAWAQERKAAEQASATQEEERTARFERLSHELLDRPLRAAQAEWQEERRLLLNELSDWRARAREHLPALVSARNEAETLSVDNECLRAAEKSHLDIRGRLEAELVAANDRHRCEALARQTADRRGESAELRVEQLTAELTDERRHVHAAQGALKEHMARTGEIEQALATRLHDAEMDILNRYDLWVAREEEVRHRDREWNLETEARTRSAQEHEARLVELRAALVDAIKTYRERSQKNSE
jgi:hypothetical protein